MDMLELHGTLDSRSQALVSLTANFLIQLSNVNFFKVTRAILAVALQYMVVPLIAHLINGFFGRN